MAQVYIKKVFTKYKVLNKIILNRNIKFILKSDVPSPSYSVVLYANYIISNNTA